MYAIFLKERIAGLDPYVREVNIMLSVCWKRNVCSNQQMQYSHILTLYFRPAYFILESPNAAAQTI